MQCWKACYIVCSARGVHYARGVGILGDQYSARRVHVVLVLSIYGHKCFDPALSLRNTIKSYEQLKSYVPINK